MATGLLEPTGETMVVAEPEPPIYHPTPQTDFVFGERTDTVRGRYDRAPIDQAATVPEDSFVYGQPTSAESFFFPGPGLYTHAVLHPRKQLQFARDIQGRMAIDRAMDAVEAVMDLFDHSEPNGRITLFQAPFRQWAESDALNEFIYAVRRLYWADQPADVIRDDIQDEHGTQIWLATCGTSQFLLLERSEIVQAGTGTQVVMRLLEAVKVADQASAEQVIDEFSLIEEIRLRALLKHWQATADERAYVYQRANRRSVQCDRDVVKLLAEFRHPRRPRLDQQLLRLLGRLVSRIRTPPG